MEKNATVFVCGDAKNMAKDVNEAFVSVIQSYKGLDSIVIYFFSCFVLLIMNYNKIIVFGKSDPC